ncbi:TPM domain-containing protein [Paludibacterium yongneupense]|uniref:TPM domain-containing protein n=1 Tax=Paludibacterium yongneupense TaxID=400061 RepID=UPI00040AFFA5|nr:TPM domain-containing protein [Paludibacterium yongneupense]
MAGLGRWVRHFFMPQWQVRRVFPAAALRSVEDAIRLGEQAHAGQVRFAIEGALPGRALYRGQTARDRAVDVFSRLRVWDTEHNNGVLVYVLLADRAVEIVADRGIHARVGEREWAAICRRMEDAFRQGRFREGAEEGVRELGRCLAEHFPAASGQANELPDGPVLL